MKFVKIENFRCFSELEINFGSGVNLLIGDNASGKTSLLNACKYVLGSFFAGYSDENTKWNSFSNDDFRQVVKNGIIEPIESIKISSNCDDYFDETVSDFYIKKTSAKNSRMLVEGLRKYKKFASEFLSKEKMGSALPLFACFPTEDIHSVRRIKESKKFKDYFLPKSFGYYECLNGNGFLPFWLKRLLVLEEGKKSTEEVEIVKRALKSALGTFIEDIDIRPVKGEVFFIFKDGREVSSAHLPDGYRRLVNIVVDVAFRCALLNRDIYGCDACSKTRGTVLIDEIDMHLHPSLQRTAIRDLEKAFPSLQFVITTHAPMVMSGVEISRTNRVYKIGYAGGEYHIEDVDAYGMDLNTITEAILDITPRDEKVDERLKILFNCIDNEKYEEAERQLATLQKEFGDRLPELSRAETMLNFLKDEVE